jgi:Fur family zinc uptake transcriptional regulator
VVEQRGLAGAEEAGQDGDGKAYDLLARIKEARPGASPPTVYRALDFLIEQGLAHKIGRMNLFVACRHASHQIPSLFLVCPKCSGVTELQEQSVMSALSSSLAAGRASPGES